MTLGLAAVSAQLRFDRLNAVHMQGMSRRVLGLCRLVRSGHRGFGHESRSALLSSEQLMQASAQMHDCLYLSDFSERVGLFVSSNQLCMSTFSLLDCTAHSKI